MPKVVGAADACVSIEEYSTTDTSVKEWCMPSTRYTVRLPLALDTAVQEHLRSSGTPFATLMREALSAYLADTPPTGTPTRADSADMLREMQAQLAAVLARVEVLELALTTPPTPRRQGADRVPTCADTDADKSADRALTPADTGADRALTGADTPKPSPQVLGTYDRERAVARMRELRREGLSYEAIAGQLTAEGISTRYGLPWEYSSVRYLFRTYG
jgi:hypothetical protein